VAETGAIASACHAGEGRTVLSTQSTSEPARQPNNVAPAWESLKRSNRVSPDRCRITESRPWPTGYVPFHYGARARDRLYVPAAFPALAASVAPLSRESSSHKQTRTARHPPPPTAIRCTADTCFPISRTNLCLSPPAQPRPTWRSTWQNNRVRARRRRIEPQSAPRGQFSIRFARSVAL